MSTSETFQLNSDSEIDYEKDLISEQIVNLLTDVMRKQYCLFLEKLLIKNFETWCNKNIGINENPPENWIKKCVQMYEMKAIKSCMIAQFYRKSMLKIMENIRHNTINGKLDKKMKLYSESSDAILISNYYPYCVDATTQTIKINNDNAVTQTFIESILKDNKFRINKDITDEIIKDIDIKPIKKFDNFIQENKVDTSGSCTYRNLSLDEKIELFKDRMFNVPPEIQYDQIIDNKNKSSNKRKRCSLSPQKQNYEKIIVKDTNLKHNYSLKIASPVFSSKSSSPVEQLTHIETSNKILKLDVKEIEIIESKEDDIAKQLDKIFCDEETDFNDIFGLNETPTTDNSKNNSNLKEIESDQFINEDNSTETQKENKKTIIALKNTIPRAIKEHQSKINHDSRLRDSIWPCELHMQTKHLREILSEVGIIFGMRFHEKIKLKFVELFGTDDDDNDDFAPYSPTMELNDVLLSSCKARIAPWIVKYLMIPMKDGLIKDRIVFKKFAKRMANKIVTENQYPSEMDIKDTIVDYFILKKRIDSIEDIDIT